VGDCADQVGTIVCSRDIFYGDAWIASPMLAGLIPCCEKSFLRVIPKSKSLSLVGVSTVEQSGMRTDYLDTTTGDI
jgi:hypothetical protein